MSKKKTIIISLIILAAGAVVTLIIFNTEPTAKRGGATKETAMLVSVTEVHRDTFNPTIVAMGSVVPTQDIILSPRVSGEVISMADEFVPGGYVSKGEVMLQIDPSDYKNTLQQRKSELQQAQADLDVEMGRQTVAEKDYQLVDEALSGENKNLVLRKPQLDAARSKVQSAKAAVDQAQLELNRTAIKAPFNAHVLSRKVNMGSQVAPGQELAHMVGLDNYWVEATIPVPKIRWLTIPDEKKSAGAEAKIRNRSAWPEEEFRMGNLFRLVGSLENQTRLARVLINVPDPLAYKPENKDEPVLMLGTYVEVSIKGKGIANVIRLKRDYLRKNETVWVMKDEKLRIRDVKVLLKDAQHVYISEGLSEGEKVVTTNLSTVVDGARLRLVEDNTAQDTVSNLN